ncbi:hypothetical protein L7F22_014062 [Adiantum nelumboides]|nr:hypothetical protein [Adiantum nelumboides]
MKEKVTLDGSTSNNEAEYDVLISGLKICLAQKIQSLMMKGDALLIVKQILGIWACKNERLRTKVTSICKLFSQFEEVQLYHIPRKENEDADLLAQQAVSNQDKAHVVIAAIALKDPQYAGMESLTPVVNYILEGEFSKEFTIVQRRKLIKQASTFLCWLEGALYQKGKDLVCRKVPSTNEITKILKGLHEEVCGGHFSHELTLKKAVIANGPFEIWGIDAMGPLLRTTNGKVYIFVAIDYMTRFGTPLEIVSDNGPGFRRGLLTEVCEKLKISHRHSTPYYPQSNGLVEKANEIIACIIRKMVESRQEQNNDEAWIDKLLSLVELEWKRKAAYHCYERKSLQLKDKLNEGLKDKEIKEESLVLRYNNALDNRFDAKFERRWEGPFIVKKAFTGGYYQLMDLNGKEHPRKVNGYRLKPYLSHILPAVFETKKVSKKTKKAVIANGPFEKWGIDAMGPLPRIANGKVYILVAIDYMTRFGTPLEIVSDNGPGFRRGLLTEAVIANGPFEKWGIDAMGPLPRIANGKVYILVAIDYMTRFGTPLEIVSDNGPGFRRGLLTEVYVYPSSYEEWELVDCIIGLFFAAHTHIGSLQYFGRTSKSLADEDIFLYDYFYQLWSGNKKDTLVKVPLPTDGILWIGQFLKEQWWRHCTEVIANVPFKKWGIDAMVPLPRTANGKLYILVAIDYMTRWVEAQSVARVNEKTISKFVYTHICCRFGTLLEIVSDNGPWLRRGLLTEVCEELKISHRHSTPYYPQSNGFLEKANGIIAGIIRKMVESKPKRWDNFLDGAIWAYRTKYRDAIQFTPFHLVYGQEALQPIELNIPSIKLTGRQEKNNDEAWIDRLPSLVELEWKRKAAYHCYERKALQLKDKLNEGLKDKEIKEESLVLRYNNALDNRFDAKFERRWEGPFIVKKAFTSGYYQLMDLNGKEHPRKVNGYRLKPYLSRILPTVFETKQVSKKTKKVCCHCCSGTHQVKSCAFQHVLHEVAKTQKKKLSSPTSCSESSF